MTRDALFQRAPGTCCVGSYPNQRVSEDRITMAARRAHCAQRPDLV
jgi:hypothetical protein